MSLTHTPPNELERSPSIAQQLVDAALLVQRYQLSMKKLESSLNSAQDEIARLNAHLTSAREETSHLREKLTEKELGIGREQQLKHEADYSKQQLEQAKREFLAAQDLIFTLKKQVQGSSAEWERERHILKQAEKDAISAAEQAYELVEMKDKDIAALTKQYLNYGVKDPREALTSRTMQDPPPSRSRYGMTGDSDSGEEEQSQLEQCRDIDDSPCESSTGQRDRPWQARRERYRRRKEEEQGMGRGSWVGWLTGNGRKRRRPGS
ncbi:unnamed protein product [Discosporangium mesarthrocarpum]